LERLPLLEKMATRVSLEHGYTSTYRETYKGNPSGVLSTESQRINEGFSPLAGVSITFKGNVTANIRYGINKSFDLTPSSKNVVLNSTNDLSVTGSYAITGFEIPVFGVSLTNDLDFSMSYTFSRTLRRTYPVGVQTVQQTTQNGEGQSRTVLEPRVRYVLSSRVTASVFYRYTKTAPDALGSRIPGSTTNEGGADVHIAIQ
jgi:cell surface protein SprA